MPRSRPRSTAGVPSRGSKKSARPACFAGPRGVDAGAGRVWCMRSTSRTEKRASMSTGDQSHGKAGLPDACCMSAMRRCRACAHSRFQGGIGMVAKRWPTSPRVGSTICATPDLRPSSHAGRPLVRFGLTSRSPRVEVSCRASAAVAGYHVGRVRGPSTAPSTTPLRAAETGGARGTRSPGRRAVRASPHVGAVP